MNSFIEKIKDKIVEVRRDLHKHPEPGWTEFRTAAIAIKRMQELGYTITMGKDAVKQSEMMGVPTAEQLKKEQERAIAQGADKALVEKMTGGLTGFWADMKFSDGPTFAFRFDMDSNDANESSDAAAHRPAKEGFASVKPGAMHACGHDGHVAIGLAVAEYVASIKDQLKGSVRFIFQPAEEGLRGAGPMVEAGAVKGVDYILGMHIGFQASKAGMLICGSKGFLASTKWDVTFKGEGSHAGAYPQDGKNALLACCNAAINLHAISRHSGGTTRINVGKIVAGEGRNVIPPSALMIMETRGVTSELNDYMVEQSARIVKAAAEMYDCEYSIEVTGGTKSGESSPEMYDLVAEIGKSMPQFKEVVNILDFGAGEDYSHMMTVVQQNGGIGTYVQVGADRKANHHNKCFDFDEKAMLDAVELAGKVVKHYLAK